MLLALSVQFCRAALLPGPRRLAALKKGLALRGPAEGLRAALALLAVSKQLLMLVLLLTEGVLTCLSVTQWRPRRYSGQRCSSQMYEACSAAGLPTCSLDAAVGMQRRRARPGVRMQHVVRRAALDGHEAGASQALRVARCENFQRRSSQFNVGGLYYHITLAPHFTGLLCHWSCS